LPSKLRLSEALVAHGVEMARAGRVGLTCLWSECVAIIEAKCHRCGEPLSKTIAHVFVSGRLHWWGSYRCTHCHGGIEEDGWGRPPLSYRSAILEQDGIFCLTVNELGPDKSSVWMVLRGVLGFPLSVIPRLKGRLPGPVVSGTRAEMECLAAELAKENVGATVALGSVEDVLSLGGSGWA
jgi:hypothetical protein